VRARVPVHALLLGALALLPAACGREEGGAAIAKARERGRLVVLTEVGFPYFGTRDERGELTGFDMDLAREMGKELGVPVEFRDRKFDLLFGELQRGAGDVVVSGVTVTESRRREVDFSEPYFLTRTLPLLARPRADDVKTVSDLDAPGRRVVAKSGTTGHEAAKERLRSATLYTLDQENLCALEVAQGRADAFVYDEIQVRLYAREHAGTTRVLEEQMTVEPYAVACRRGDRETVAWVDGFLARARKDGRIDALIRKHLPGIEPPPRDG
jgi:polar amino acid transport system substrate-binding protein